MFAATIGKLKFQPRIAFTPEAFIFAEPLFGQTEKVVAYRDITEVSISKIKGQRYLNFTYPGGQGGICDATLKSRTAFDEISALLTERVKASALATAPEITAFEGAVSVVSTIEEQRLTADVQGLKGGSA